MPARALGITVEHLDRRRAGVQGCRRLLDLRIDNGRERGEAQE